MNFYLIGVDYKSAKIETREKLLRARHEIVNFWQNQNQPFTILSTCNRFEIYNVSTDAFGALRNRDSFYEKFPFWYSSYFISGKINVFRHILRLASGLESQLKGETQILRQIFSWIESDEFPEVFKEFWSDAFDKGKNTRVFSGLNEKPRNIANLVFRDIGKKRPFDNSKVIIVGTGNIAELFVQNKPKGLQLNFVSTKHRLRAKKLAEYFGGKAINFKELPRYLPDIDFLITATTSPHFILKKADIPEIVSNRPQPLYIYDLALPRAIEPEVRGLKNIILQNLDDLSPLFETENLKIQENIKKAEILIEETVKDYEKNIKARNAPEQFSIKAD